MLWFFSHYLWVFGKVLKKTMINTALHRIFEVEDQLLLLVIFSLLLF